MSNRRSLLSFVCLLPMFAVQPTLGYTPNAGTQTFSLRLAADSLLGTSMTYPTDF